MIEIVSTGVPSFASFRSNEFEGQMLDDIKWVDDFATAKAEDETDRELEQTAKALLGTVTDPKINETEVWVIFSRFIFVIELLFIMPLVLLITLNCIFQCAIL